MPKFKEPLPLREIAFDSLVARAVGYCVELSIKGFLLTLRQGIAIIKKHVYNNLSGILFAEFCTRFLDKFYAIGPTRWKRRPANHQRAALEIIMDIEIVGLRCGGKIIRYLDPQDGHRFHGLIELNLNYFPIDVPISLENFRLKDLTAFHFERACTDMHLRVIGWNCSNLQILRVRYSRRVTDVGLRALSLCSDLRVIDAVGCPVPPCSINDLLSLHKRLTEFSHGQSHDIFFHLDSVVCPFMNRFVINSCIPLTSDQLQTVVEKFPNLTHLSIKAVLSGGLCALKSLKKLTILDLENCVVYDLRGAIIMWESLKRLIISIGANIACLKVKIDGINFRWVQNDVNFIFHACPNIECLSFDYVHDTLVIPPFLKLKELIVRVRSIDERFQERPVLEFGRMLKLETIWLSGFSLNYRDLIFDNVKFPSLTRISTDRTPDTQLYKFQGIVKSINLDMTIFVRQY